MKYIVLLLTFSVGTFAQAFEEQSAVEATSIKTSTKLSTLHLNSGNKPTYATIKTEDVVDGVKIVCYGLVNYPDSERPVPLSCVKVTPQESQMAASDQSLPAG